jgi:hypothetical protein
MRLRQHPRRFLRRIWPRSRPDSPPLLREISLAFTTELESLLRREGRLEPADSVATLRIFGRCPCSDLACASFYTSAWRDTLIEWARAGETIRLHPDRGEISVDTAGERILSVEVLGRRDVWLALAHVPVATEPTKGEHA